MAVHTSASQDAQFGSGLPERWLEDGDLEVVG